MPPPSGHDYVFLGNGQGLNISSVGSTPFTSLLAPNTQLHLNDILLVPSITKNLVCVRKFARDNNVCFEFYPTFGLVKSLNNGQVLLCGQPTSSEEANVQSSIYFSWLWGSRFREARVLHFHHRGEDREKESQLGVCSRGTFWNRGVCLQILEKL